LAAACCGSNLRQSPVVSFFWQCTSCMCEARVAAFCNLLY
jgi:hypothetical protein